MTTVHAYAATKAGGQLEPFEYELGPIGPQDIDIAIEHCGICHTDLSMINNDWSMSHYPLVPGHEVVGTISAAGEQVTHLKVGDRVGTGAHLGYCLTCSNCLSGHHNLCANASSFISGKYGGFADKMRVQAASAVKLPSALDAKTAGPLFCGGITVFNPLVQYDISPLSRVGVIGIGGLGHLALQFARAWGCEVTAFTSSEEKQQEALNVGAHHAINSRDADALKAATGSLDLLLSTVNVTLDWDAYIGTLKPQGRLHFLGVVLEPLHLNLLPILFGQLSLSGSIVGSPATIAQMLDFCARHDVKPVTEHFQFGQINDAMEHLRSGKARYRIVLSH